jgi:hypothetical protein
MIRKRRGHLHPVKRGPVAAASGAGTDRCARSLGNSIDPSAEALVTLLDAERSTARNRMPDLVSEFDPDEAFLLWFAIGATNAICSVVDRPTDTDQDRILRHAMGVIFEIDSILPATPNMPLGPNSLGSVELFEQAGREAVRACLTGDTNLSFYLEALSEHAQIARPRLNS